MTAREESGHGWRWTLLAAGVGFLSSFVLSSLWQLPRSLFVAGYGIAVMAFVVGFASAERLTIRTQLGKRWVAGALGGLAFGLILVRQVLLQPASTRSEGLGLIGELVWYGGVYGVLDALLLSIVPVLSLYGLRSTRELQGPGARLQWGTVAILGSAAVTAAYHAGFTEFRGPQLVLPIVGNSLITLAYLLTGSPVAPIISHVLMHGAAVLHGMGTTVQLPPHY